jgi:hypothetical protein
MNNSTEIIESHGSIENIEAHHRAEYEIQIATAKRFPRDLTRVKNNCIAIVTMDNETAESCRFSIPSPGKIISGKSVHLARIIAQQYGNILIESRVKQITDKQILSEAVCFDFETNYACRIEVRRSILQYPANKSGIPMRMSDDMITVIGNACNAIALRNAIFNVIPAGISDAAYKAALQVITGDLSDEKMLIAAREKVVKDFKVHYGIDENRLLRTIGLTSVSQVRIEQIADLKGMIQSLKDGDATIEGMFPKTGEEKKENLKIVQKKSKHKNIDLP